MAFPKIPRNNEDIKSAIAQRLVDSGIWTVNETRKRLWNMEPKDDSTE
ncbi:MAG: hypothetical protein ACUZ77_09970 [Candidatus Brocadiales bacterium]